MSLNHTYNNLRGLLSHITADLSKAENGNKAAAQRVRTGTVKLEKVAKAYRKESIASERGGSSKKKSSSKSKASSAKKPAAKAKPKAKVAKAKSSALSVKRASAKLPARRFGLR